VNAYPDTRLRAIVSCSIAAPAPAARSVAIQGLIVEDERDEDGHPVRMATVLLTGRECPWRCAMCDLWAYTIERTPARRHPGTNHRARRAEARDEAVAGIKRITPAASSTHTRSPSPTMTMRPRRWRACRGSS
jgi:hypothetical protein